MMRPHKLAQEATTTFLAAHAGWAVVSEALEKEYRFPDYGTAVGFVVRVALAAEKRDHHPDILLSWGKVRLRWTTHDAGGITALDVELATLADSLLAATVLAGPG